MKLKKFDIEYSHGGNRRTIFRKGIPLKKIESFEILKLTPNLNEPFHINRKGSVFCLVIDGWMDAWCEGKTYHLKAGEGILFEKREKHRIIKGEGWMLSSS